MDVSTRHGVSVTCLSSNVWTYRRRDPFASDDRGESRSERLTQTYTGSLDVKWSDGTGRFPRVTVTRVSHEPLWHPPKTYWTFRSVSKEGTRGVTSSVNKVYLDESLVTLHGPP